jgi:predicted permease
LDDEVRFHLEMQIDDNIARGMLPDEARYAALRSFGAIEPMKEKYRDRRSFTMIETTLQDVRYALRTLRKSPGYANACVITLALGVGANIAIFGVLYGTLLRPLPYANPDQLVALSVRIPQLTARFPSLPVRPPDIEEFRRSSSVVSGIAAVRERDFNLTEQGEPERVYGARVTANLFDLLGVQPQLGRGFLAEEDAAGRDTVVLISHDFWVRRFAAGPRALNAKLTLDGVPHVVVGIMPRAFPFPTGRQLHPQVELGPRVDIWKPMAYAPSELAPDNIGTFSWGVLTRLKPGVTLQQAQANLDAIAHGIGQQLRSSALGMTEIDLRTQLTPIRDVFAGNVHQGLVILMCSVGLLLVIVCVNLANLLLARLSSRTRELATRMSLGAPRARLVRQVLTESLVLAVLGGIVSIPIAVWGARLLLLLGPADLALAQSAQLSVPVLLFGCGVVVAAGLAVGLIPALTLTRGDVNGKLIESGRGVSSGRHAGRLRGTLITAQVMLCAALLVVAGLMLRSFVNVSGVEKGFDAERVLSVDLALPSQQYGGRQTMDFYSELLDGIRSLPGVTAAGAISSLPLTPGSAGTAASIYYATDTTQRFDRPVAHYRTVTPGYFAAMGIPLAGGRFPEQQEPSPSVVVSQGLAQLMWPGEAPSSVVGRRIHVGRVTPDPVTIVGVVGDVRTTSLDRETTPTVYVPHARNRIREVTLVIRTATEPETLIAAVRNEVWKRDNRLPIPTIRTIREVVSESLVPRKFQMTMILLFAILALGLAIVGVYGVTSYAIASRRREIGIRIAIGAQGSEIARSVLAQGLRPVFIGLVLGFPLAAAATTTLRAVLFGVTPFDPAAFTATGIALLVTAALACYLPARRAMQIDPMTALRQD